MNFKASLVQPGMWGMTKSSLRTVGREAIRTTGLFWHANFKWLHFQKLAFERYGFKQPSPKYAALKERQHPEAEGRPLVFTGESERDAMAANKVDATASSYEKFQADCIINGPNLNFHPDMASAITREEEETLEEVFAQEYESEMLAAVQFLNSTAGQRAYWETSEVA